MTQSEREEAIRCVKAQLDYGCLDIGCHDQCEYNVVREAIDKQVPMKASKVDMQPYFKKHFADKYTCPVCGREISSKWNGCPYCLQAIDFSN